MQLDGTSDSGSPHQVSTLVVAQLAIDLRNLLMVMGSCVDSIRQSLPRGPDIDQTLAELDGAVDGAFYISRELLALVRPPQQVQPAVVDVNELVAQARNVIDRVVGEKIRSSLNLAAARAIVRADAVQLEWVLLHLAWNAADAMPNGGVLKIETASVDNDTRIGTYTARRPHGHVRLTVSDTGRGMTEEVRSRAFEPFFTTKKGGTGLGLTSVAITIGRLGGSLSVQDNVPHGTRIDIYLPTLGTTRSG